MKRSTIFDVAKRAGVSIGTVSNVLNGRESVAVDIAERVQKAVDELGFVRNSAARQLRGARSLTIGLIVREVHNPVVSDLMRGVEDVADEADHLVILCASAGDPARERRHLALLEQQRVVGVLMTVPRNPPKAAGEMHARGTPVVFISQRVDAPDHCNVAVDEIEAGALAARHLAELGHTRMALISGPLALRHFADRRTGFINALREAGLRLSSPTDIQTKELTITAGHEAASRLLRLRRQPSAIFCLDDLVALGAEKAILAAGYRIPDDIALVGYNDVAFASTAATPLTTIRNPAYEIGHRATRLLFEEASDKPHTHDHVRLIPELVIRESTVRAGASQVSRRVSLG